MRTTSSHIRKINSGRSGFTIIETLVAITVLMIAVAGPLVVATRGLNSALASKNQMIASYLAQDTLETIKNVRDGNIFSNPGNIEGTWLSVGSYTLDSCYEDASGHSCDLNPVDADNAGNLDMVNCQTQIGSLNSYGCKIYYNSTTGYTHSSNSPGVFSGFYRRFYLDNLGTNNGKSERRVHVIVDWFEGTVPYQVHVTGQLIATSR